MKKCPKCQREVPDYAVRCPFSDCGCSFDSHAASARPFTGTIPAAPPLPPAPSAPASDPAPKSPHAFAGTIPAAPPLPPAPSAPASDPAPKSPHAFAGTIPAAPPLPSAPSAPASDPAPKSPHAFAGTIPAAPPLPSAPVSPESSTPELELELDLELESEPESEPEKTSEAGVPASRKEEVPTALPYGKLPTEVSDSDESPNAQKRVEPAVVSALPNGKRVEPPVAGFNANGKRVEPPVAGFNANGKRVEPPVAGFNANGKRVEPPVRRVEPPVLMTPGFFGFTPGTNYLVQNAIAILPELRGDETQEELALRDELINMHFKAQNRLKKGRRLVNASFLLVLLVLAAGFWCYHEMVWSFAMVDPDFTVTRDPLEPERILLTYVPGTKGRFAISYEDERCETTIQESLQSGQIGEEQTFGWRIRSLKNDDRLTVTYRNEFRLVHPSTSVGKVRFVTDEGRVMLTDCRLRGEICDATTGNPIPNAGIRIPGTSFQTRTKEDGSFELRGFPEGDQPFEASAEGFISYRFDSQSKDVPIRILLSPGLADGQIRIVLSWEMVPEDLDAHLEGPLPDQSQFHISYGNQGDVSKQFVNLDIDDSDGFGPETITVLGVVPGTYRYYVHDYSHQGEVGTSDLAKSGAMVKIYFGNQVLASFTPDPAKTGNLWNVCEIKISDDQQASVTPLGDFEDRHVQAMGLYEKRTQTDRLAWIEDYGGNAETEEAAALALEWLARHQCVSKKFKDDRYASYYGAWGRFCLDPINLTPEGPRKNVRCRCDYPEDVDFKKLAPKELTMEDFTIEDSAAKAKKGILCLRDEELASSDYAVAMTGMAVLAFQAGGNYFFNDAKYSENVKIALDWLVRFQGKDGSFLSHMRNGKVGHYEQFMYEHAIATFAIAEACALAKAMKMEDSDDCRKYRKAMNRAVRFILETQHRDGGWRYREDPAEISDTSVSGWVVLALKSAREAGFELKPGVVEKIRKFYDAHTEGNATCYQLISGGENEKGRKLKPKSVAGSTEALTGIGMLVRQFLLEQPDHPYVRLAAARLKKYAVEQWKIGKKDPDFYAWYKCSLALQQYGNEEWETWNEIIRAELIRLQCRDDDCLKGSWTPSDIWSANGGGRIYATALGALTLQVYYRYTTQRDRRAQLQSFQAGEEH